MHKTRCHVLHLLETQRLLPVFYHPDLDTCREVLLACYQAGLRTFEFTNRGPLAHELFRELKTFARQQCPDLCLGAGTVMEAGTAALFIQLGADFVVSPVLQQEVMKVCHRRKILHIPGVGTLSEISQAEEWGADLVKVFPGQVLGPAFVKALLGPMPASRIMVTGGVLPTIESVQSWLKAGAVCVGLGSQLFPEEVLGTKNYAWIREKVAQLLQDVQTH